MYASRLQMCLSDSIIFIDIRGNDVHFIFIVLFMFACATSGDVAFFAFVAGDKYRKRIWFIQKVMNNGHEFLEFVAKNEGRLKRNLRKNVTYDNDIFDDVFQTAIVKVYDSIVRNDKWIDDFEQYFFISTKFEYILHDNRARKAKAIHDKIDAISTMYDEERDEERDEEIADIVKRLEDYLIKIYGERDADIFLRYYRMKSQDRCSYIDISEMTGLSIKTVTEIIQKIKADENLQDVFYAQYKNA